MEASSAISSYETFQQWVMKLTVDWSFGNVDIVNKQYTCILIHSETHLQFADSVCRREFEKHDTHQIEVYDSY